MREYKYNWDVLYLKCSKCWKWGELKDFPVRAWAEFWVRWQCKECRKKMARLSHQKWYENNEERAKESFRKYHKENKDKINYSVDNRTSKHSIDMGFAWYSFHSKAKYFVRKHNLRPTTCPICWLEKDVVIHHPSYETFDKWSEIVFCCKSCHSLIHSGVQECPKPIKLLELGIS